MLPAMTTNNTGRFVWYELLTTDPKAAQAFYPEVIGWKTQPYDEIGGYTMWVGNQGPLGGVMNLPEQARAMGAPSFWQSNVEVANVDEAVAKVKQLGGQVFHVEDVPKIGKIAVIADPQGAVLAIFTPLDAMASHDITKHGEFSWHELYTTDYQAAFAFYNALFGWDRIDEMDMGPAGKYLLWGREGRQLGGMMTITKEMKTPDGKSIPPSWLYYITVEDFDAAHARATAKGARVLVGPMEVPGGQRIVQMMDPTGAAFALVTPPKS
jgi:predicted enzyme related to lactoylglutathione lyase